MTLIDQAKLQIPYVPYRIFEGALEHLELHGIPARIDRTPWPSFSAVSKGPLISAHRFFGLVGPTGTTTPQLERLVKDKANRKLRLRRLLREGHPRLMALDLAEATIRQFHEMMGTYQLSPETTKKASSSFLQAAKDADLPMSSHILARTRALRRPRPGGNR